MASLLDRYALAAPGVTPPGTQPWDRQRAVGNGAHMIVPRHKPDPNNLDQPFPYEQFVPLTPEQEAAQLTEFAAGGGGRYSFDPFRGDTIVQPGGAVMGAYPTQPSVNEMAGLPFSAELEALRARSQASPRGQQMMADDAAFRQKLAGIDRKAGQNEMLAQNIDNGAFINALRFKFAGTPLATAFDYFAGLHEKSSQPPQRTAQAETKPAPVSTPAALQPAIQRYARQN